MTDALDTSASTSALSRPLLGVAEPSAAVGDAAAAAARIAFAAECIRLAELLDATLHLVTWPGGPDHSPEAVAAAVVEEARAVSPAAILLQDGDSGRQLAPFVAFGLGTGAVLRCSDARAVDAAGGGSEADGLTFVKPIYGGWLEREVRANAGFLPVATLDVAGVEPPEGMAVRAAAALDEAVSLRLPPDPVSVAATAFAPAVFAAPRVHHVDTLPPDPRSVDLVHAERIVAAGMGAADEEVLAAVHQLADLLRGSVGATRPMVDEGRLPKERLIGQTGRTVTPELYLALGISGSPHHVAGVRKADRVLSVNRDVRAPIFHFSDVGYVADLAAVLPALIRRIESWRDGQAGGAHRSEDSLPANGEA